MLLFDNFVELKLKLLNFINFTPMKALNYLNSRLESLYKYQEMHHPPRYLS